MAKKKTVVATPESTSTYLTRARVRHGADRYAIGEEIELLPSEAEHLLASGAIIPKSTNAE